MTVGNTLFIKRESLLITCESGPSKADKLLFVQEISNKVFERQNGKVNKCQVKPSTMEILKTGKQFRKAT